MLQQSYYEKLESKNCGFWTIFLQFFWIFQIFRQYHTLFLRNRHQNLKNSCITIFCYLPAQNHWKSGTCNSHNSTTIQKAWKNCCLGWQELHLSSYSQFNRGKKVFLQMANKIMQHLFENVIPTNKLISRIFDRTTI